MDKIDILIPITVFILTFIVYIKFLAPSVLQGDSAEFCIASYTLGIPHPTGYPIYTWIGHLFSLMPIGSVAYRINLMSAFFAAFTSALIYVIVFEIAKFNKNIISNKKEQSNLPESHYKLQINVYRVIALIAALALAFSKSFWLQAEIAEVYTLNAFFIALMILILIKWSENENIRLLYIFFLVYGLSLGAHASNILFMPIFLLFIGWTNYRVFLNYKNSSLFVLLFLMGLSQYIYILIRASQFPQYSVISPGIDEWWMLIIAKQYSYYLIFSLSSIPERILIYFGHLKANFFIMGYILGVIGIIGLINKNIKLAMLLIVMFILNIIFYLNYYVFDVEFMFIPSFLIFSIFIGVGVITAFDLIKYILDKVEGKTKSKNIKRNILKILIIFILASSLVMVPITSYINNYNQIEQQDGDSFEYFVSTTLNEVPSNSTIITYWKAFTAFKYFQIVEGINSNVTVIPVEDDDVLKVVDQYSDKQNVFLVHNLDQISGEYYLITFWNVPDAGTMYRIIKINKI